MIHSTQQTNSELNSSANGLTAKDNSEANCYNVESTGHTLQQSVDNLSIPDEKIPSRKKIKTLVNLSKGVDVYSGLVFIDPTILFICLIALAERSSSSAKHFGFDSAPYSTTLFKDHYSTFHEASEKVSVSRCFENEAITS